MTAEQLRRLHRVPVSLTGPDGVAVPVAACIVLVEELDVYEDALYDASQLAASAGTLHEFRDDPDACAELEAEANCQWNRLTLFASELHCAGAADAGIHHG